MAKKLGDNAASKLNDLAKQGKQELVPPDIGNAKLPEPAKLDSVRDIREEMTRVYKFVWQGKIQLGDATRLAYYLDRMIQAIKTETELDKLAQAYANAWSGVEILTGEAEGAIDGEYTKN